MADIITNEQKEWLIEKGYYKPDDKTMNLRKLFAKHKREWDKEQSKKTEQEVKTITGDDVEIEVIDTPEEDVVKKDIQEIKEEKRIRSANSDTNDAILDQIRLKAMLDLGHISQEIYNKGISNPSEAIVAINSKMPLKESQMADFETKFIELAIDNETINSLPSVLAKAYTVLKEQAKDGNNEKAKQQFDVVRDRIDNLITQAANKEGSFFANITNIADAYDGYMDMMKAREADLDGNSPQRQQISNVRNYLNAEIAEYDDLMNLNTNDLDATELYERYSKLEKEMKKVELTPEHLKMLSSVKFTDEQGEPVAQFVDKDGKDTVEYTEGCKIKKDSQLDTFVKLAKAQVAQEELGSAAEVDEICTPERLQEQVSSLMYGASVVSKTQQGIDEDLDEFTKDGKLDKDKLNNFVAKIRQEEGMRITPLVYEKTLDKMIDATGAYANRLGTKVGKDKTVVMRVLDSVKDIDKRADGRTTPNVTKRQARIEMLKRTLKTGVSAFAISGAITLAATAGDAGLTALTGGTNKIAGTVLGVGLGLTMTAIQIHKWRKQKKARGEPRGLRAMIKDPRLGPTLLTTALGSAALGFAATGNPGVAMKLGYASMAVGMTSGAVNTAIDAKQMGLSTFEAAVWGIAQAGTALGSGFAGRAAAQGFVNHYNQAHPENRIFQHEEIKETTQTNEYKVVDVDKINSDSESFLRRTWFKDDPSALDALIKEHGSAEAVQYKIGAGAIEVPALSEYNNVTRPVILTESWAQQNGIDPNIIDVVKNYPTSSSEFQSAMDLLRPHYEHSQNYVSTIENAPLRPDLYDHRDPASTYSAKGEVPMKTITENVTVRNTIVAPNKFIGGLGMLGQVGNTFGKKLKERAG